MTLIIGMSGRARHGKTNTGEAIRDYAIEQGQDARIYDLGDLIRRYAIANNLLPPIERAAMSRLQLEVMINVGKEKRAVDINFWIHQMIAQIALDNPDVALLPNLRYQNEADAVRNAGGYVIRLTRLNQDGSMFISEDRPPNDVSETNLEFWPADFYIVTKDGHLALTCEQAITLYAYLRALHEPTTR